MGRKPQGRVKLDLEVQEAILSMTMLSESGAPTTLGDLVANAVQSLKQANAFLESNPIMKITAENLLRGEKRAGNPTLKISTEGEIYLSLSEESPFPEPQKEKLPSLDKIREQARELGVDISDLGRQKIKILKRLEEASHTNELMTLSWS